MKKILYLLSSLILVCMMTVSVKANAESINLSISDRIVDDANLLTDSQEEELLKKIENIADMYEFDVVIYTSEDESVYSAMNAADDFFDYNGYGYGNNHDGIVFYVNMATRDYWLSTSGYGITVFTDYGLDVVESTCQPYLSDGNYYEAFDSYLDYAVQFLEEAENSVPYDVNNKYVTTKDILLKIVGSLVAAMVIAGIVLLVMSKKMKTAVPQIYAKEYLKKDSFHLTKNRDLFLYSNTVRTAIPKSTSSSGGGSSTHSSSSGSSHGGSGGRF